MEPPESEGGPRPATRSSRILGLIAAVGFSVAMWVFISVAVLGLILKVVGPKGAEQGLEAAGQLFNPQPQAPFDAAAPEDDPSKGLAGKAGDITTLGQVPAEPPKAPATPPKT